MATLRAIGGRAVGAGAAAGGGVSGGGSGRFANCSRTGFGRGGGALAPRVIARPRLAWTASASPTVTRSALRGKRSLLRPRFGVERELRHAQLAHDVDDVHDVAVRDPAIGRDDGLQLGIAPHE